MYNIIFIEKSIFVISIQTEHFIQKILLTRLYVNEYIKIKH